MSAIDALHLNPALLRVHRNFNLPIEPAVCVVQYGQLFMCKCGAMIFMRMRRDQCFSSDRSTPGHTQQR